MFSVYPAGLMKLIYAKLRFAKLMAFLAKMEIALHQADVNVRWDGKFLHKTFPFQFRVNFKMTFKLKGLENFVTNAWPYLVVRTDFVKPLCNVFVKKDGRECFAINVRFIFPQTFGYRKTSIWNIDKILFPFLQPFALIIAFMEVVLFLVNVCVIQAGLVQNVTNAWRILTVCMADVLTLHFSANVMMDTKALAVKSQYAVQAAILSM